MTGFLSFPMLWLRAGPECLAIQQARFPRCKIHLFFTADFSFSGCRFLCTWATNRSPLTCHEQNRGWDIFHCRWECQENCSTEETPKHVFKNAHRRYGKWFYERVSKQSNLLFLSELQNGWKKCHPTPEEDNVNDIVLYVFNLLIFEHKGGRSTFFLNLLLFEEMFGGFITIWSHTQRFLTVNSRCRSGGKCGGTTIIHCNR